MSPSAPIRIAQILGITTSAVYSGTVLYQYLVMLPSYISMSQTNPVKAVEKWYCMHIMSKGRLAPAALAGVLINAFLTVRYYISTPSSVVLLGSSAVAVWKMYALTTACFATFIPWTAKVMLPINFELEHYHQGEGEVGDERAKALLVDWRNKSVVRAAPAGAAAVIGAWLASW
ncbi:hypothetical protein BP6252_02219 [Coleophoma cylindrospora]|uniref:DUF1772-domain-containing protein n=1 Tax=Coleophoma cylindrospora TaxID=1849047 RepID=A0A3D8SE89_9HELO|nr:hypothetical protein BP6252_02219 [Coleophoma cylindrospora]